MPPCISSGHLRLCPAAAPALQPPSPGPHFQEQYCDGPARPSLCTHGPAFHQSQKPLLSIPTALSSAASSLTPAHVAGCRDNCSGLPVSLSPHFPFRMPLFLWPVGLHRAGLSLGRCVLPCPLPLCWLLCLQQICCPSATSFPGAFLPCLSCSAPTSVEQPCCVGTRPAACLHDLRTVVHFPSLLLDCPLCRGRDCAQVILESPTPNTELRVEYSAPDLHGSIYVVERTNLSSLLSRKICFVPSCVYVFLFHLLMWLQRINYSKAK